MRLVLTLLGTCGLRLDRDRRKLRAAVWLLALCAGVLVDLWLDHLRAGDPGGAAARTAAAAYAALVWTAYYAGNSLVLGGGGARWAIRRLGERRAFDLYEVVLGAVYLHQGLAQSAVITAFGPGFAGTGAGTLHAALAGSALVVIGMGAKIWATMVVGLDTYYYRDMFLGRGLLHGGAANGYLTSGPYRYFRNPMYGIGNLHSYGAALVAASVAGLICAAIFQASIYVFYFLFERPFCVRSYPPAFASRSPARSKADSRVA